jgi:hypothetical protein
VSWSAGQLRILRAMGHEPMRLAPVGAPAETPSRPTAASTTSTAGALAAAIARAAGGRDLSALALDLDKLRREPALKRALWPRLRALRRDH